MTAGFVPVITHPERLTWLNEVHYPWFVAAARQGARLQITAGALTGRFGSRAKYWGERLLGDGIVQILATDAHGTERPQAIMENRDPADLPLPPGLAAPASGHPRPPEGRGWLAQLLGGR